MRLTSLNHTSPSKNSLSLSTQDGIRIFNVDKIAYFKAEGSYSTIYLEDGTSTTISKSLITIQRNLKNYSFIRCHNSYLINSMKIEKYNRRKRNITIGEYAIPISRRRCHIILELLKSLNDQI